MTAHVTRTDHHRHAASCVVAAALHVLLLRWRCRRLLCLLSLLCALLLVLCFECFQLGTCRIQLATLRNLLRLGRLQPLALGLHLQRSLPGLGCRLHTAQSISTAIVACGAWCPHLLQPSSLLGAGIRGLGEVGSVLLGRCLVDGSVEGTVFCLHAYVL